MKLAVSVLAALMLAAFAPDPQGGDQQTSSSATRRMTISTPEFISMQLIKKRCWADHSDMPEARRLRTTFRVWFGRDGKFSREPEMVAPATKPTNDPPMQTFIVHARRALDMCNMLGWDVPEGYFAISDPPPYLDIEFIARLSR